MFARQKLTSTLRITTPRYNSTESALRSNNESLETVRESMRGKVPRHQSLLLLYTEKPANEWPSKLQSMSLLYQTALSHQPMFQGQTLICYSGSQGFRESATWQGNSSSVNHRPFQATFFSKFMEPLNIDTFGTREIERWARLFQERVQDGIILENMMRDPAQARSLVRSAFKSQENRHGSHVLKKLWILVCTHGARDCRCGQYGTMVVNELREEIRRRNLLERVHVGEVSHVGNHASAANVLVYPYGDWYGTMRPENVPSFLDSILGVEGDDSLTGPRSPLWRGSWFDTPGELNEAPSQQKQEDVAKERGIDMDAVTRGN